MHLNSIRLFFFINVFVFLQVIPGSVTGQSFSPGNLTVLRVGDGTTTLSSSAFPLTIVEYTTSGSPTGTSLALPTTGSSRVTTSGVAFSEGLMSLSAERDRLIVAGYDALPGVLNIASTTSPGVHRVLAKVTSSGAVIRVGESSAAFSTNNSRSGTASGSTYFGAGAGSGPSGVVTMVLAPVTSSAVQIPASVTNCRVVQIFNGQLYFSSNTGSYTGVSSLGTGIPTTTGQPATLLASSSSAYGFSISPDGNTLYIADDGTGGTNVGITKYTKSGSTFVIDYVVTSTPVRGLCVDYSGTNPVLYATTISATDDNNTIIQVTDAGAGSTPTTIASAGANYAFRGITFSPTCNATIAPLGPSAVCSGDSTTLIISGNPTASISYNINGGTTLTTTIGNNGYDTLHTGGLSATATYNLVNINTNACAFTSLSSTTTVTVNPLPATITGNTTLCTGTTEPLSDASGGGLWSSSNTSVASVGTGGIVSGGAAGTANITYTLPTGCITSTSVTVILPPASITGIASLCSGGSIPLTDGSAGGTWSSSNTSIASVGSGSGVVSGLLAGTAGITYTIPGCTTTTTTVVTVNPTPTAITGIITLCTSTTTVLTDALAGGTWSSSNTSVATIGTGGIVSGVTAGTASITYAMSTGCMATTTVTVNLSPLSITGTAILCSGNVTALSDATLTGAWSSSNTSVATISSGGNVSAIGAGTATISYVLSTGCMATTVMTVNASPAVITGSKILCTGATSALSDFTAGGTWSSSNTSVATVGTSGAISGAGAGTAIISYTLSTGCLSTITATVNLSPSPITGTTLLCTGTTTPLSDAAGGTWSSGGIFVATVGTGGVVSGVGPGTANITYTLSNGCTATTTVTVDLSPSVITGVKTLCTGTPSSLTDGTGGGAWSSSNTTIATIGTGGVVSGVGGGTASISYVLPTGCFSTTTVTVNPSPSAITGSMTLCTGTTTALTDAGGGTWSSSNGFVATVGTGGVVSGVGAGGTATITYTLSTGCKTTTTVTVYLSPSAIAGSKSVCTGLTTLLTDALAGGTWSSSNTSVASIGTGGVVSGIGAGTASITYQVSTGCIATVTETVNITPSAITGGSTVCTGTTISLSDATPSGAWSSSAGSIATIGTSGVVSGISAGSATITYMLTAGGCFATQAVTVISSPASIIGIPRACTGGTVALSDYTAGGTWSSSNTSVATIGSSGIVSGLTTGTSAITYTVTSGCTAITTLTVNPSPLPITGNTLSCTGGFSSLSDATPGGNWFSSYPPTASVGFSTGTIIGVSPGTVTITYSLSTTGCTATTVVTVYASPAPISGYPILCANGTLALTDATGGGTWSSSNTSVAINGSADGIIAGVSTGTTTISYTLAAGCLATKIVTVYPAPAAITGSTSLCAGRNSFLSDASRIGFWNSSDTFVARIVHSTGSVAALTTGTATITYTLISGCLTTTTVTVYISPAPITGNNVFCAGAGTTLSDTSSSGTWTSDNISVASVIAGTGVVSGVSAGTANITYTIPDGCIVDTMVTVNPLPLTITGNSSLCVGSITTLSDTTLTGSWTSDNTSVATIDPVTGLVAGLLYGTADITYELPTGCLTTSVITVDSLPLAITDTTDNICVGAVTTLSDASPAGSWSSSNTTIATINATGGLTAISSGSTTITYMLSTGCISTTTFSVDPLPAVISGTMNLCIGQSTVLTDSTIGGTWSCSDSTVIFLDPTGLITGLVPGTSTITYESISGCITTSVFTVNPLPSIITGLGDICVGGTFTLSDSTIGGTWTSGDTNVVLINGSGVVTGRSAGTSTITYSLITGCIATIVVPIGPFPSIITGGNTVCAGSNLSLTDSTSGGYWHSANSGIASINPVTGALHAVSYGTTTISYTMTGTGCQVTETLTVNPLPYAGVIFGSQKICINAVTTVSDDVVSGKWRMEDTSIATIDTSGNIIGKATGNDTVIYTYTNMCGSDSTKRLVTVYRTPNPVNINIYPDTLLCTNTQYQNYGTRTSEPSDAFYIWGTQNASIAATGAGGLNCLVSFNNPGTALVWLSVGLPGSNCVSIDTIVSDIGTRTAPDEGIVYYSPDFVCTDNTSTSFLWGYDDAVTLDSTALYAERNQNYTNPNPDFSSKYYWVMTVHHGCVQKTYFNTPASVKGIQSGDHEITVFPNPADATLNIRIDGINKSDMTDVSVYDMPGRKMLTTTLTGGKGRLDIADLNPGIYILSVSKNGANIGFRTFVKR